MAASSYTDSMVEVLLDRLLEFVGATMGKPAWITLVDADNERELDVTRLACAWKGYTPPGIVEWHGRSIVVPRNPKAFCARGVQAVKVATSYSPAGELFITDRVLSVIKGDNVFATPKIEVYRGYSC